MEKERKDGQIYLVSTIILAVIVISIIAVSNYSNKNEFLDLQSLKDELNIEASKVIDYGISQGHTHQQINQDLTGFTQIYIDTETRDKNLYFVFGTQDNITLKGFQRTAHSVSLEGILVTSSPGTFFGSIDPSASSVSLVIDGISHVFELKNGENFFFIISREVGGQNYVITG